MDGGLGAAAGRARAAWAQHHRARGGSTCPRRLPVTGSSLSHAQGPQVGPLHLGLSRLATKHLRPAPRLCYLLPRPSAPSFLLTPPLEPGGLSSALSLSHAHALSFLSVSDSATWVTFLLSPWLFTCSSLPLLSRPFPVVGYTLSLPESLSPTLLFSGVCLDHPFSDDPCSPPSRPHAPQEEEEEGCWPCRGLRSCPGVGGAPPVLLLLHVPFLLLSSWPLSPRSRSTSPPWFSLQTESYTGTHTHPALKTGNQSRHRGKGGHWGGMERPDMDGDQDKGKRRGRRRWSPRSRKRGEGTSETSRDHGATGTGQCPGGGGRSWQRPGSDSVAGLLPPCPHQCPCCAVRVRCVPSAQGLHAC